MGCIQRYAKEKKKDPKLYFKIPRKNRLFGSELQMEDIKTFYLGQNYKWRIFKLSLF